MSTTDVDAAEVRAFLADKLNARDDRDADWLSLVIVSAVCLLLSAFFAGSETALTASSRASMSRLEKQRQPRAGIVNRLLAQRERLIGALLLGNNAVNIAASVAGDRRAARPGSATPAWSMPRS